LYAVEADDEGPRTSASQSSASLLRRKTSADGPVLEMTDDGEPMVPDPMTLSSQQREKFMRNFLTYYYSQ
jgi:hypothetical protein